MKNDIALIELVAPASCTSEDMFVTLDGVGGASLVAADGSMSGGLIPGYGAVYDLTAAVPMFPTSTYLCATPGQEWDQRGASGVATAACLCSLPPLREASLGATGGVRGAKGYRAPGTKWAS